MLTTSTRRAFATLPLVLGLLALSPVADELAFHPKDGSEVGKKLAIELELGLDSVELSVNGQDIGEDAIQGLDEAKVLVNLGVATTDAYVKSKDGQVLELLRTFDDLSLRSEMGEDSKDDPDVDAFEGQTVRFLWNADKKEYERSFKDGKGDVDALVDLSPDQDVTCLLPDKKVAEGDTWKVKGDVLRGLFFPGGVMPRKADGGQGAGEMAELVTKQLAEKVKDFEVTCTYKGAHEDGKLQLGEIAFQFDGKIDLDLAELLKQALEADAEGEVPDLDLTSNLSMKGEGTLKWDVAAGRLHALAMTADLGLEVDADADMQQDGQSLKIHAHLGASGKGSWELGLK